MVFSVFRRSLHLWTFYRQTLDLVLFTSVLLHRGSTRVLSVAGLRRSDSRRLDSGRSPVRAPEDGGSTGHTPVGERWDLTPAALGVEDLGAG